MVTQTALDFTTSSPINIGRLSGQNKRLFDFLQEGNKINCFSDSMKTLKIGYLNSRISDLKNKFGIEIKSEFSEVEVSGEKVSVKLYWLEKTS